MSIKDDITEYTNAVNSYADAIVKLNTAFDTFKKSNQIGSGSVGSEGGSSGNISTDNTSTDFKNKYLKYKEKYYQLKKELNR